MEISPHFKLIFITCVCITLLCLMGIFYLTISVGVNTPGVMQTNFYTACNFGWQAGLGAIFGLIGGKVS
jgi:hypothetical protein